MPDPRITLALDLDPRDFIARLNAAFDVLKKRAAEIGSFKIPAPKIPPIVPPKAKPSSGPTPDDEADARAKVVAAVEASAKRLAALRKKFSADEVRDEHAATEELIDEIVKLQQKKAELRNAGAELTDKAAKKELAAQKTAVDAELALLSKLAKEKDSVINEGAGARAGILGLKRNVDVPETPAVPGLSGLVQGEALARAGDFLSRIAERGLAARDSLRVLSAQTGLTGADLDKARASAEGLFKRGLGADVGEATKAFATAKQQLGSFLDEKGLQDFTLTAGGIAKVFDVDVNETIGKSRTFLQNFGLDGKKGGDLVALAMQGAGNQADDVLDTLSEYSPVLKENGLSAEDFVGVLTRGIQAGTRDTDKLADSLKEAGIRLRAGDASKALKDISAPIARQIEQIVKAGEQGQLTVAEVIQKTTALSNEAFESGKISDSVRSQLQIAIAGTPAEDIGTEMYGRIFGAPIDAAQINAQAAKAGEQIGKAVEPQGFFEKFTRGFEVVKERAAAALAPFANAAGGVLQTVGQVGPGIAQLTERFGKLGGAASQAKGVIGGGGGIFGALPPQALIVAGVIAAVVAGFTLLYNRSERFRNAVDRLVARVKELGSRLYDKLQPAIRVVGDALEGFVGGVLDVVIFGFESFVDLIADVIDAIADLLAPAQNLGGAMKDMGGAIGVTGEKVSAVTAFFDKARLSLAGVLGAVRGVIGALKDFASAVFSADFTKAWNIITSLFGGDTIEEGFASGIRQRLRDDLAAALGNVRGDVEALIQAASEADRPLEERRKKLEEAAKLAFKAYTDPRNLGNKDAKQFLDALIQEINAANEALGKVKPPPGGGDTAPPPPTERQKQDLSSQYVGLFRDIQSKLAEIDLFDVEGQARSVAELREQFRQQLAALTDQREALVKQFAESKDTDFSIDVVVDGKKIKLAGAEARKAVLDQYEELIRQTETIRDRQLAALGATGDDASALLFGIEAEALQRQAATLRAQADAITAQDVQSVTERQTLLREALKAEQEGNVAALVAESATFAQAVKVAQASELAEAQQAAKDRDDALAALARRRRELAGRTPEEILAETETERNAVASASDRLAAINRRLLEGQRKLAEDFRAVVDGSADTLTDSQRRLSEILRGVGFTDKDRETLSARLRQAALEQRNQTLTLDRESEKAIREARTRARLATITDTAEREREQRKIEIEKALDDELALLAEGEAELLAQAARLNEARRLALQADPSVSADEKNRQLAELDRQAKEIERKQREIEAARTRAKAKAQADIGLVELEATRKTNILLDALLRLRESIAEASNRRLEAMDREARKSKLDALRKEEKAIRESFNRRLIDATTYADRLAEIERQRTEINTQIEDAGQAALRAARLAGFQALTDQTTQSKDRQAEASKRFLSNEATVSETFGRILAEAGIQAGASIGKLALIGEESLKAYFGVLIDSAFSALQAMVPIFSATILGYSLATPESIATFGLSALLEWAALTTLLETAVAAARASVSGLVRAADGVVNVGLSRSFVGPNGRISLAGPGTETSDSIPALLSRGESVITARATKAGSNAAALEWLNRTGRDLAEFYRPKTPTIIVDSGAAVVVQHLKAQQAETAEAVRELGKDVRKVVAETQSQTKQQTHLLRSTVSELRRGNDQEKLGY